MSDDLLIALSRRGEVTWPTFRYYAQDLTSRQERAEQAEAIAHHELITPKVLESLGHVTVDFSAGAGTIHVAPRVLARLPVAVPPRAVLVGHRLADTEHELQKACAARRGVTLSTENGDNDLPLAPRRLLVEAEAEADLVSVARSVEARYSPEPAAWRVLQYAGTIDQFRARLRWLPQRPPNWGRREFTPNLVAFREPAVGSIPCDGLGEYLDPQTGRSRYYLCRSNPTVETVEVDRDWGRYLVLAAANRSVLLFTDAEEVAVPLGALLPAPYATGLALCRGYAPYRARVSDPACKSLSSQGEPPPGLWLTTALGVVACSCWLVVVRDEGRLVTQASRSVTTWP
jgi:hypothetical protein